MADSVKSISNSFFDNAYKTIQAYIINEMVLKYYVPNLFLGANIMLLCLQLSTLVEEKLCNRRKVILQELFKSLLKQNGLIYYIYKLYNCVLHNINCVEFAYVSKSQIFFNKPQ